MRPSCRPAALFLIRQHAWLVSLQRLADAKVDNRHLEHNERDLNHDKRDLKHAKSENEGTFNSFKGEMNGEKIDFIFISQNIKVKDTEIVRDSYDGKYPSDHFPVTALLSW